MKVAYVRVSTEEQNEARQIEALKKHGIEKWFTEKISGKSMDRPQLQAMLDYVREGDTVYIHPTRKFSLRPSTCFSQGLDTFCCHYTAPSHVKYSRLFGLVFIILALLLDILVGAWYFQIRKSVIF